jgi:hypothetical protein
VANWSAVTEYRHGQQVEHRVAGLVQKYVVDLGHERVLGRHAILGFLLWAVFARIGQIFVANRDHAAVVPGVIDAAVLHCERQIALQTKRAQQLLHALERPALLHQIVDVLMRRVGRRNIVDAHAVGLRRIGRRRGLGALSERETWNDQRECTNKDARRSHETST